MDVYGGFSEAFEHVEVKAPVAIDLRLLNEKLTTLVDEQNTAQLVALATTFVSTITASAAELSDEQKTLQMTMVDSVSMSMIKDQKFIVA